jgi:transcription antitermination factor NusG
MNTTNTKWFALFVVQGKEFFIKDRIDSLEIPTVKDVLVPTIKEISEVRRKKIVRNIPVYPGYIFINAHLDNTTQSSIINVTYVVKFLGIIKPYAVRNREMDIVQAIADDNRIRSAFSYKIGDMIEILGGHCKGLSGKVIDIIDINTIKIEIQIFNRTITTVIKLEDAKVA